MAKNLEQHLRENAGPNGLEGSEYVIRVQRDLGNRLQIYVRPLDRDGNTVDYVIERFFVTSPVPTDGQLYIDFTSNNPV